MGKTEKYKYFQKVKVFLPSLKGKLRKGIEKGQKDLISSMLKNGLKISLISKVTGFSETEISKLKENLS